MKTFPHTFPSRYVRASALAKILGVSKSTIWRWQTEGNLPEPIHLSTRVTVWVLDEIFAFIQKKREDIVI